MAAPTDALLRQLPRVVTSFGRSLRYLLFPSKLHYSGKLCYESAPSRGERCVSALFGTCHMQENKTKRQKPTKRDAAKIKAGNDAKSRALNASGSKTAPAHKSPKNQTTQAKSKKNQAKSAKFNAKKLQKITQKYENSLTSTHNMRRPGPRSNFYRFAAAVAFIAFGAVLFLMLFSFTAHDLTDSPEMTSNIFGMFGAHIADIMLQLFGVGAFHFSFVCLVIGICICSGRQYDVKATEIIGLCLLIVGTVPLLALGFAGQTILDHAPGGVFGQWLYALMHPQVPDIAIVSGGVAIVIFGFLLVTDIRLKAFVFGLWRAISWLGVTLLRALASPFESEKRPTQIDDEKASRDQKARNIPAVELGNAVDDSGSLYYEDTPSQLLNGVACDLPERVAMANERDDGDSRDAYDETASHDNLRPSAYDGDLSDIFDDESSDSAAANGSLAEESDPSDGIEPPAPFDGEELLKKNGDADLPVQTSSSGNLDSNARGGEPLDDAKVKGDELDDVSELGAHNEKVPETLGDIMARIKKSAPKSRSIRRSHSVPALEPEFEFESILSPEQLQQVRQNPLSARQVARDGEKVDVPPRTPVLQNWKPRSIDRRAMMAKCAVQFGHANDGDKMTDAVQIQPIPAAEPKTTVASNRNSADEPQNITRDILAQLSTGDFDVESHLMSPSGAASSPDEPLHRDGMGANSAVTRMAIVDGTDAISRRAEPAGSRSPNSAVTRMALSRSCDHLPNDDGDLAHMTEIPHLAREFAQSVIDELEQGNFDDGSAAFGENDCFGDDVQGKKFRQVTFRRNNAFDLFKTGHGDADSKNASAESADSRGKNPDILEQSEQWRALMADANPDFLFTSDKPLVRKPAMRSISYADKPALQASDQKTRIPTLVPSDDLPNVEPPKPRSDVKDESGKQTQACAECEDGFLAFSVAEEKKRPSAQELDNADNSRREAKTHNDYSLPPLSILHYEQKAEKGFDRHSLDLYAKKIKEKLEEYKVYGDVINVCPGPVVTRFEYLPAPGTKVAKVEGLSKDLMMALEIMSIRILAPIPGKNVIGIEIPNEHRNTIYFKEVVGSQAFQNAKSLLTIALGKDSEGEPVVSDLAKMPHLLVAGTTGSGKSVGINTMLCSLLYNATPDEVKLILVDPKMLELSIYAGIPHLLVPPITTPHETAAALEWACDEMDERYRKLASFGVRNISGYNQQLRKPTLPSALECMKQTDAEGNPLYKPMPYIVIVVDEFADLMMVAGKEIEKSIARLAQKARAAGIHIILATQRPSTNIITGVIKANFPTRLAFKVMTLTDSRVILDQRGAETLLGNGDSLFLAPTGALARVHGAFVSDDEVQAVVAYLAQQRQPEYNFDIITPKDETADESSASMNAFDKDKLDDLFDEAVEVVREAGQASASLLQRRLGIGFNRGARLIEQMERQGIVGPARGQKPREVLL